MIIEGTTIIEVWEQSIQTLIKKDIPLSYTQRGVRAKEILGLQLVVTTPTRKSNISSRYIFGDDFIEKYCNNIMNVSSGVKSISSRIIGEKTIGNKQNNQIDKVVRVLKNEPESRRALISLWDSQYDSISEHPPCVCTIQFFIRNNKINTITYYRSNDAWMAALPDMISMLRLTEYVASRLKIDVGQYFHFAASYHIYEPDIIPATYAFRTTNVLITNSANGYQEIR